MSPSSIFAIITAVIIILGRIINRSTEKQLNSDDTTREFDAEHDFSGEEAIPARKIEPNNIPNFEKMLDDDQEALAKAIRKQIIESRKRVEAARQNRPYIPTQAESTSIHNAPRFEYTSSRGEVTIPQARKPKPQPKKTAPKQSATVTKNTTSQLQDINTAASNEMSDIAEEFDLAKAVIYAEILKPKFDQ